MADVARIGVADLAWHGRGLSRPECVLATADGRLYVSDWRGGVTVLDPAGAQRTILADGDFALRPNGICLMPDGAFLVAHLGERSGGVFRLRPDGALTPALTEVDGRALPPTNYVHRDGEGRIWVTVSTRRVPRASAYRGDIADGFVVLIDRQGARIVADGLGYTNECVVHPDGRQLYVNETFARRLSAFDISMRDGRAVLGARRTVARFAEGDFPDGLTFDAEGGVWITSIVSNRVIRLTTGGAATVVLEDNDPETVRTAEAAFQAGAMGRPHLDTSSGARLRNVSSLAFGGPQLTTAYLGCLLGDAVASFDAPVAGWPPPHWAFHGPAAVA